MLIPVSEPKIIAFFLKILDLFRTSKGPVTGCYMREEVAIENEII